VFIEVPCTRLLPSQIPVQLSDEVIVNVKVKYAWKPNICERCQVFGHLFENCEVECREDLKDKQAPEIREREVVQSKPEFSQTKPDKSNWSTVVGRKRRAKFEGKRKQVYQVVQNKKSLIGKDSKSHNSRVDVKGKKFEVLVDEHNGKVQEVLVEGEQGKVVAEASELEKEEEF